MVAILKAVVLLATACGALALAGCHGEDADAPVANPAGRLPDPTKFVSHPPGKKLVPIPGMHVNPGATPASTVGAKLSTSNNGTP